MTKLSTSNRKLVAILFADIEGFTSLMQRGEKEAMMVVDRFERMIKSKVTEHQGEVIKNYGDGTLILFGNTLDAVHCALQLQLEFQQSPVVPLRIGIHVGEIVRKDQDVFGNGVNVASRVESLGVAGSILCTKDAYKRFKNQDHIKVKPLGTFTLKNVDEPIEIFAIQDNRLAIPDKIKVSEKARLFKRPGIITRPKRWLIGAMILALLAILYFRFFNPSDNREISGLENSITSAPLQKSIAVLPLENFSGNDELEWVCDGMTSAIISRLMQISGLDKVSPFTSSSKFKNSQLLASEIAAELSVNYLVQGNFQMSGEAFKISLALLDAQKDEQTWTYDYSGIWDLNEIFSVQAEVTENLAQRLDANIRSDEIARIERHPTLDTEAYNSFLQAEFHKNKNNAQSFEVAIPLYERTIEKDSTFIEAYLGLAHIWHVGGLVWGLYPEQEAWTNTKKLLKKAMTIDSSHKDVTTELHSGAFYFDWDMNASEKYLVLRDQNNIMLKNDFGIDYFVKTHRFKRALERVNVKIDRDPNKGHLYGFKAEIFYFLGRHQEALEFLQSSDKLFADDYWYLRESTKLYLYLGAHNQFLDQLDLLLTRFEVHAPIHHWFDAIAGNLQSDTQREQLAIKAMQQKFENQESGSPAWFIALYHFYTGNHDTGFNWLQKSYDRHEVEMTWLQEEPLLQDIKDDPRYISIYNEMGFPKVSIDM